MRININKVENMVDLFDNYKFTLYSRMKKMGYSESTILDFLDGYSVVVKACRYYMMEINMKRGFDLESEFNAILFSTHGDIIREFDKIIANIGKKIKDCAIWQKIGMKYAACLGNFYLDNILTERDNETEEDDFPYVEIPDKDYPGSYDWDEHGYVYKDIL